MTHGRCRSMIVSNWDVWLWAVIRCQLIHVVWNSTTGQLLLHMVGIVDYNFLTVVQVASMWRTASARWSKHEIDILLELIACRSTRITTQVILLKILDIPNESEIMSVILRGLSVMIAKIFANCFWHFVLTDFSSLFSEPLSFQSDSRHCSSLYSTVDSKLGHP